LKIEHTTMNTPLNVTQKLISAHLIDGEMIPGSEIGLRIDQTLTQDATGTMVMLELEAMGLGKAKTEVSVQYVDHNLLQADFRNADDHLFLRSAAQRFGLWYSMPGNGVSHPVHMERFGIPGAPIALEKGPNIQSLPKFDKLRGNYSVPVLLKMADNMSTDEILKAGVKALAYRSNIPEISKWSYAVIREEFYKEAKKAKEQFGGHVVVAGYNYAQGR
jgi:aconitase A